MGNIYDYEAGARADHPDWSDTEVSIEAWLDQYVPGKKPIDDKLDQAGDALASFGSGMIWAVVALGGIAIGFVWALNKAGGLK